MCRRWCVSRLMLITLSLLSALPHCLCDCKTIIESQRRKKKKKHLIRRMPTRQTVRCISGRPCRRPSCVPSCFLPPTPIQPSYKGQVAPVHRSLAHRPPGAPPLSNRRAAGRRAAGCWAHSLSTKPVGPCPLRDLGNGGLASSC